NDAHLQRAEDRRGLILRRGVRPCRRVCASAWSSGPRPKSQLSVPRLSRHWCAAAYSCRVGETAMLELIWIVIIGTDVGALAKLIMPGRDAEGFFFTALLGMGGALVATFLGRMIGLFDTNQNAGFIASIVGALIVLAIYHGVRRRQI